MEINILTAALLKFLAMFILMSEESGKNADVVLHTVLCS